MTDQEFLGVNTFSNNAEIKNALIEKISVFDFEIDLELIFQYIHCSQRLIQKTNHESEFDTITITEEFREIVKDFKTEEGYNSPEKLIQHFDVLYDNPRTRFNYVLWKSAIDSLQIFDNEKLEEYVKPIADFLITKHFLKSDVLHLIAKTVPFGEFFSKVRNEENEAFWKQYQFVQTILVSGNLQIDLHGDAINTGQFSSTELDDIFRRIIWSSQFYGNNLFSQAFHVLNDGMYHNAKPLIIWQRELNILYKAIFIEKKDNAIDYFLHTLNNASAVFPDDEQLIYMRCKFLFHFCEPEIFKYQIISTLKRIPGHEKALFLLGKCYMQLNNSKAALVIFENLEKINPSNMQYFTAAAVARREYIDFYLKDHSTKNKDKQNYIAIINTLIDNGMFDEVFLFLAEVPEEDNDSAALLVYAKDVENYSATGQKDKKELKRALTLTSDKEIIRKIKEHYVKDLSNSIHEKDFIRDFYYEYPNDYMANNQMGAVCFLEENFENAYNFFLKAKEIEPDNINNYFNLAQAAKMVDKHLEAIEYITIYLKYNKYSVAANEIYCDCSFVLKDYKNTYNNAKWLLNICSNEELDPKYFFYFTTSLWYYINESEYRYHNLGYINSMLEVYDQYPKPTTFWSNDNGSMSMYWAAKICHTIGNYKKGVEYLECILESVKEYNWLLMENCKFELLPECLIALEEYEKLLQLLENPTLKVLEKGIYDPSIRTCCVYISYAYSELGNNEKRMKWALHSVNCFMQMNDPPIDWVGNYLLKNLETCLELEINTYIIPIGKAYLEFITTPQKEHVWVTEILANFYSENGEEKEALKYHQMCFEFAEIFIKEQNELLYNSQKLINLDNISNNLN